MGTTVAGFNLFVDGKVYGFQSHGGINTYFNKLLVRLARMEGVSVDLLLPRRCVGAPPGLPVRRATRDYLPVFSDRTFAWFSAVAERVNSHVRNLLLCARRQCVFHSTFFTRITDKVPQVATAHDLNQEIYPEKYTDVWGKEFRRRSRDYLTQATRVIAVSHKTRNDLIRFYGMDPARIDVIHHAIDPDDFYLQRVPAESDHFKAVFGLNLPYILYVGGRAHHYKNFDCVLKAFARSNLRRKYNLTVAGRAFAPEEIETISQLGLRECVHLVETPDVATLRLLYNFATAFVFPSFHEGFGLPLLEAMACGTVVLASDTEVFREVAGDAAVYFDPHEPAALATSLARVVEEEAIRLNLIERGLERVKDFSWDRCAEQTYQTYCKALKAHHS
jgi:glycosyltransferase involved in cell wall biosynthesis